MSCYEVHCQQGSHEQNTLSIVNEANLNNLNMSKCYNTLKSCRQLSSNTKIERRPHLWLPEKGRRLSSRPQGLGRKQFKYSPKGRPSWRMRSHWTRPQIMSIGSWFVQYKDTRRSMIGCIFCLFSAHSFI